MPTPKEIFDEINSALTSEPQRSSGINASYQFDLTDDGNGGGAYYISLKDGTGEAAAGEVSDPNTRISMSGSDFVDLATGKLNGMQAFMGGKLKITGDMALAMKLQDVLVTPAG